MNSEDSREKARIERMNRKCNEVMCPRVLFTSGTIITTKYHEYLTFASLITCSNTGIANSVILIYCNICIFKNVNIDTTEPIFGIIRANLLFVLTKSIFCIILYETQTLL